MRRRALAPGPAAPPRFRRGPRRSRGCATTCVLREALAALPRVRPRRPTSSRSRASCCRVTCSCGSRATRARCSSEGKDLPLGVVTIERQRNFVLAYSSGDGAAHEPQAPTATPTPPRWASRSSPSSGTSSPGPTHGLILDHASAPARAVLPRELLEKLLDQVDRRSRAEDAPLRRAHRCDGLRRRRRAHPREVLGRRRTRQPRARLGVAEARHRRRRAAARALLPPARGRVVAAAATRRRR